MIVIDATNIGVGGGTTHLIEIIDSIAKCKLYDDIIIYASNKTLQKLPDYNFITKKSHSLLNKSLLHRFIFQSFLYKKLIPPNSILFSIAGDFFTSYHPMVGMSRNMLLFERKHWKKMNMREQLRLFVNYQKQKLCFKKASGIIFVSNYSKHVINKEFNFLKSVPQTVIHHGVSQRFYSEIKPQLPISNFSFNKPFVFNYVSTVYTYKNHPEVIRAFHELRKLNYPVFINFIGAIIGKTTRKRFLKALTQYDPKKIFSYYCGNIPFDEVHKYYQNCDGIIYASSCENMPNIVIEAMLSGKPLVCSNLGPIPEFVKNYAFFFNPEDAESIKDSVISYLNNPGQRAVNAVNAQKEAVQYNWDETAKRTVEFIREINNETDFESKRKTIVLVLLRWYLPGYKSGGALRSVANLIGRLGDEIDFRVVTSDRDFGDDHAYPKVVVDEWNDVGKAKVYYASPSNLTLKNLTKIINESPHDLLYLNSFFDPLFTFLPLLSRRLNLIKQKPMIIAPRGEFSLRALQLKHWKKKPFIFITRTFQLFKNIIWQASNENEAKEIQRSMGKFAKKITIAPDLPSLLKFSQTDIEDKYRIAGDPMLICFLSRISPMKNLDFALRVLSRIQIPVIFDIYGPIDDHSYWKDCEALIHKINEPVKVRYHGTVEHNNVYEVFRKYHLFFFPTLGENFGHVILESMLSGTPVLIADTTPWRNLEKLGIGWDLPLDSHDEFLEPIKKIFNMPSEAYMEMRKRVRSYAVVQSLNEEVLAANKKLFNQIF